ncbi:MAG: DUF1150 family protein [Pseudomonadota bacterium]
MTDFNSIPSTNEEARHMTAEEFAELGGRKLVYVRAVIASDVMTDPEVEEEFGDIDLPDDATLYSVHAADGERLALVSDRDIAFAAAKQYEMHPVSVH